MEQLGTWGDHVSLQAIADAFGLRINILTSYPDSPFIAISPATEKSHRCLYLSFWAEVWLHCCSSRYSICNGDF